MKVLIGEFPKIELVAILSFLLPYLINFNKWKKIKFYKVIINKNSIEIKVALKYYTNSCFFPPKIKETNITLNIFELLTNA